VVRHCIYYGFARTGKRPLVKHGHRCEDNIRMHLVEIGWKGVNWIQLDQVRDQWLAIVYMVKNFHVP
jgi:hypothetical protein